MQASLWASVLRKSEAVAADGSEEKDLDDPDDDNDFPPSIVDDFLTTHFRLEFFLIRSHSVPRIGIEFYIQLVWKI